MDEQLLKDFLETANQNNYDYDIVMPKFPELEGIDLQLLKDYAATAKKYNYDYDIINPKFPEFFGEQGEVKKKDESTFVAPQQDVELVTEDTSLDTQETPETTEYQTQNILEPIESEDAEFEASLKTSVTPEMIADVEEFVVPEMQYKFGKYGFDFEETDILGDEMRVKVRDTNKELRVPLNKLFFKGIISKELEKFLRENKRKESEILKQSQAIVQNQRTIQTDEELNATIKLFNKESERFVYEVDEYAKAKAKLDSIYESNFSNVSKEQIKNNPVLKANYGEWLKQSNQLDLKLKDIEGGIKDFRYKGAKLDRIAGEYTAMKAKQGTWWSGFWNKMMGESGPTFTSMSSLIDLGTYLNEKITMGDDTDASVPVKTSKEQYKKDIIKIAQEKGLAPEGLNEDMSLDEVVEALGGDTNDVKLFFSKLFSKETLVRMTGVPSSIVPKKQIKKTNFDIVQDALLDIERKTKKYYEPKVDPSDPEGKRLISARERAFADALSDDPKFRNPFSVTGAQKDNFGNEGMVSAGRRAYDFLKDKSTTEQWIEVQEQGNFLKKGFLGLGGSLPAMLGTSSPLGWAQRTAQMYNMSTDYVDREMEKNPMFDKISEAEKTQVKMPIGVATAVLENIGLRNIIAQKGLLNSLVSKALRKSNKNTTAKTFQEFIRQDVQSMIGRGALVVTGAGLAEFETGFAQEIAAIEIKDVYNASKESKMFETPETFAAYMSQVVEAGLAEAVGGFVMGSIPAVTTAVSGLDVQNLDPKVFEIFENTIKEPTLKSAYISGLKNRIADPSSELDKKEAQKELDLVNKLEGIMTANRVPFDEFNTKQRMEALQLLLQKETLENEIKEADKVLSKPKQELLDRVNERLEKLTKESIDTQEEAESEAEGITQFDSTLEEGGKTVEEKDTEVEVEADDEVVYEMNKTNKRIWSKDFEIIDNRQGQEQALFDDEGNETSDKWWVVNKVTGQIITVSTKAMAKDVIANAPAYAKVFGDGTKVEAEMLVTPAPKAEVKVEAEVGVDDEVLMTPQEIKDAMFESNVARNKAEEKGDEAEVEKQVKREKYLSSLIDEKTRNRMNIASDIYDKDAVIRKIEELKKDPFSAFKFVQEEIKMLEEVLEEYNKIETLEAKKQFELNNRKKPGDIKVKDEKLGLNVVQKIEQRIKTIANISGQKRVLNRLNIFKKSPLPENYKNLVNADLELVNSSIVKVKDIMDMSFKEFSDFANNLNTDSSEVDTTDIDNQIEEAKQKIESYKKFDKIPVKTTPKAEVKVEEQAEVEEEVESPVVEEEETMTEAEIDAELEKNKKEELVIVRKIEALDKKQESLRGKSKQKDEYDQTKKEIDEQFKLLKEIDEKDVSLLVRKRKISEKKTDKETQEEQADIQEFFKDELDESVEGVSPNLSINKKGKPKKVNKNKARIIKIAKASARSIAKLLPKTKIVLHETKSEYFKYTGKKGRGYYDPVTDTIHIDLTNAKLSTVPHEVFHAVFLNKLKTDAKARAMAIKMVESVKKTLSKNSKLYKEIDAFSKLYTGEQAQFQEEEFIAELIGLMSSQEFKNYKQLKAPAKYAIVEFLKKIAKKFGIKLGSEFGKDDQSVIDLINVLATKTVTGEEITEQDVKILTPGTPIPGADGIIPSNINDDGPKINLSERFQLTDRRGVDESKIKRGSINDLSGTNAFVFAADQAVYGRVKSPTGLEYDFDGGFLYPYGSESQGSNAAWVFSAESAANKVLNKAKESDGVGLVMSQASDGITGNLQFYDFLNAEIENAIEKGASPKEMVDYINKKLADKTKRGADGKITTYLKKNGLPTQIKNYQEIQDLFKTTNFEVRGQFARKFMSAESYNKFGIYPFEEKKTIDGYIESVVNDPSLKKIKYGDIISAIEFDQDGKPFKLNEGDPGYHPAYPWALPGKPMMVFNNAVDVRKVYPKAKPVTGNQTPLGKRSKPLAARSAMGGQYIAKIPSDIKVVEEEVSIKKPQSRQQKTTPDGQVFTLGMDNYNIDKADSIIKTEDVRLINIPIDILPKLSFSFVQKTEKGINNADTSVPVILATTKEGALLIDGHHRVERAIRDNVPIEAYLLNKNQTSKVLENAPQSREQKSVSELESNLEDKYNVTLDLYQNKDFLELDKIIVTEDQRNTGVGSNVMREVIDFANKKGLTIALTPSTSYGATSIDRLKGFYKGLGFVENKGINKDFTTKQSMLKLPEVKGRESKIPVTIPADLDQQIDELKVRIEAESVIEFEKDKAGKEAYTKKFFDNYQSLKDELKTLELLKEGLVPAYSQRVELAEKLNDLNKPFMKEVGNEFYPRQGTVKKGKKIKEDKDLGGVFEVDASGYLFRGVSRADFNRVRSTGIIDTDLRGAISEKEGINLAPNASTAFNYLPEGVEGVVMAIKVDKDMDLFMIGADDYVRSSKPIPYQNVKVITTPTIEGRYLEIKDNEVFKVRGYSVNEEVQVKPRKEKTIYDIADSYYYNNGYFEAKPAPDLRYLRREVESVPGNYSVKKADGEGLFLTENNRIKKNLSRPKGREQKSTQQIINEGRQANFKESNIRDFLVRVLNRSAKEVDELMSLDKDFLEVVPKSFTNIKGGINEGTKLYNRVEAYRKKLVKKNDKLKGNKKLTSTQIVDKTIEYLQKQPEYINEGDKYTVGSKKKGTQETRVRKGFSTQQARMLADYTKTAGVRPTNNMGAKIRKAMAAVRQKVKGARDLQKQKTALRNFIRQSLPKALYTKKDAIDLVNKVNDVNAGNIENLMKEVIEFVNKTNVKSLQAQIKSILNKKYSKVESGRKKPVKISDDIRKRIDFINSIILNDKATPAQIGDALINLQNRFNELAAEVNQTEDTRSEMVDLELAMMYINTLQLEDTNETKVEQLDQIVQTLKEMIEDGRSQLKEQIREQHLYYLQQFELGYEAITGNKIDMNEPDAFDELNKMKRIFENEKAKRDTQNVIKRFLRSLREGIDRNAFASAEDLFSLMDRLDKLPGEMYGGNLQEMFTERVDEASNLFKGRMMLVEQLIQEHLKEVYGKKWKKQSRQNRLAKDTGIMIQDGLPLSPKSQNQIAYLYNMYKDPANRKSFANPEMYGIKTIPKDATKAERESIQALNEENAERVMSEMIALLDPKVKETADWQVNELYPFLYNHYNDAYKKLYRTDLPWNVFYAGTIYREGVDQEEASILDLQNARNIYSTAVGASGTKVRQNSNKAIQTMDMMDVLNTYLNQMEYFAAYGEVVRDMSKLFNNKYISDAITKIHGKDVYKYTLAIIDKIASRGTSDSRGNRFINGMNNVFILSRLAISPVIMIKQLTSFITYANDIGPLNYLKYAAKNKVEMMKVYKEIRDNSVYMKDRQRTSIMRAIETYSDANMKKFVPAGTKDWIVNFAMWTTKFGDKSAIYLGGMPNYSYYKAQFKKKNPGATEQEAIDHAVRLFERDTKRTQQSGDLQDKDYYQTKDPLYRGLNMFLTTPKQYLRKEIVAIRNLNRKLSQWDRKAGKGTVAQNLRTFFMYHVIMPVFFQYVSMGLPGILRDERDDDKLDLLRAAMIGNLNALFIIGDLFQMAGDFFTGKPWAGNNVKTVGLLSIAGSLTEKFAYAVKLKDPVKKAEAYQKAYLELATFTGVPAPTIAKFVENYGNIGKDGDIGKDILRLLNFSKYQIEGPGKGGRPKKIKTIQELNEEYDKKKAKEQRSIPSSSRIFGPSTKRKSKSDKLF